MPGRRYRKDPGADKGYYIPCEVCKEKVCKCLENKLLAQMSGAALPEPIREFRFSDERKWQSDLAYPDLMILIEVEGGGQIGRHSSPLGYRQDCIKYNAAATMGWIVLRFDSVMINNSIALNTIIAALQRIPYVPPVHIGKRKTPKNAGGSESQKTPKNARKRLKTPEAIPATVVTNVDDLAGDHQRCYVKVADYSDPVTEAIQQAHRERDTQTKRNPS